MSKPKNIQISTNVATAAAAVSVSTADAKSHLKVEHSDDDTYIDSLVLSAEAQTEALTSRKMITQTVDLYLTDFPMHEITLPFSPVTSISYIKYYDGTNTQQTWAASNYNYNIYEEPTVIRYNDSAPDTYEDRSDAVNVRFVVGYANAAAIPAALISAIKLKLADLYENRMEAPRDIARTSWINCARPYMVYHNPEENK